VRKGWPQKIHLGRGEGERWGLSEGGELKIFRTEKNRSRLTSKEKKKKGEESPSRFTRGKGFTLLLRRK